MTIRASTAGYCGGLEIRSLEDPYRRFAADLHRSALRTGLFPRLGARFLMTYHAGFEESPSGVALIAVAVDEPVGLLMGTTNDHAHRRWVARHRARRMALAGAVALVCRPKLAMVFVRTRARPYSVRLLRLRRARTEVGRDRDAAGEVDRPVASLTHIAVSPDHHGAGVGSALVDAYLHAAEAAGSKLVQVVTSRDGPEAAGFYERLGWKVAGETVDFEGNPYVRLVRRIAD